MAKLCNPNASKEAVELINYLESVYGKYVLSSQHTKTPWQKEIWDIQDLTGELPAICGFELLGYSTNTNILDSAIDKYTEAKENMNTIDTAIEWAEKYKGIVTYTWHWFSPLRGHDSSFYTEKTDFMLDRAMNEDSPERLAIMKDLDFIAELLKRFRDHKIPILWRPLHECDGGWFWWGARGPEPCKWLWRFMYDRLTNFHKLDNLIWVWNSDKPDWYPGDDVVDILSADVYRPDDEPSLERFEATKLLNSEKMIALAECGCHPSVDKMFEQNCPWLWSMSWCFGDILTRPDENFADRWPGALRHKHRLLDETNKFYSHPKVINLKDLPWNK